MLVIVLHCQACLQAEAPKDQYAATAPTLVK